MDELRWGIVGPGGIARAVVPDFEHVEGCRVTAVGSRSLERAQTFAQEFGIERAHGSYRALIDDPDVDVLYIATPHPQHVAVAVAALEAGKAVLVEKSLTATVEGAQTLIQVAQEQQVFAMEAMWTRFQPAVVAARELVADGAIGDVRTVQADLGVQRDFDAGDRLFSKELGGGALLDLGVYAVAFSHLWLGRPTTVHEMPTNKPRPTLIRVIVKRYFETSCSICRTIALALFLVPGPEIRLMTSTTKSLPNARRR